MSDVSNATPKKGGQSVAALVLGIIAAALSFIPVAGMWIALVPAILAIIFGLRQALGSTEHKTRNFVSAGLGVLAIIIGISTFASGLNSSKSTSYSASDSSSSVAVSATPTETPTPEAPAAPAVPVEFESALAQAESYSESLHMSKQGIYDQLVSEYGGKFTPEAAQYAIDNVQVDWNANALAQAKEYQSTLSLSPAAVYDQLISEYGGKFLPEEADFAIAHLND
jgi:hypothetical protein